MSEFLEYLASPVHKYCGRYGPGVWEEPWNVVTNIAFLIAAYYSSQLAVRQRYQTLEVSWAIALAVAVGIGSTLFHTFAQVWAMWLDIIPIALLQCWIVWLYCSRIMNLPVVVSVSLIVVLVAGGFSSDLVPEKLNLNGSISYIPAFLVLACMAIWHRRHGTREPYVLIAATAAFLVALVFRTIDLMVCPVMPIGTHFLWHVFNGGTVYFSIRCLILNLPRNQVA